MAEPSRRDFLKFFGAAAVGATGLVAGLELFRSSNRESMPEFHEVSGGQTLPLRIPGEEGIQKVSIFYANPDVLTQRIRLRYTDNKYGIAPFSNGNESVRMIGELLDDNLVRVKKSEQFPEEENLYALSVVTIRTDLIGDNQEAFEINGHLPGEEWQNLKDFGKGYAVGKLDEKDGAKTFYVLGFVNDSRALEVFNN